MRRLHYHLVDVFTDRAFGGNPLAVVTNGRGVSDETMQAIAKEFNLSETTFVLPPSGPGADYCVRISVGVEDESDLVEDFTRALDGIGDN